MNDFGKLNERKDSILKGFIDEDIEKARSGVYANTAQNKKLGRVGQKYGGKKEGGETTKTKRRTITDQDGHQIGVASSVTIAPDLTTDPLNKQGESGVVDKVDYDKEVLTIEFKDGKVGQYDSNAVKTNGAKVVGWTQEKKAFKHDMAVFQKVIDGHKKEDKDTYDKLTEIKQAIEGGNMKEAMSDVSRLDTYQRELIPPRIYKKMGGELLESGKKKANVKTDLNLIAATGTKGDLYRAINKKYGTKFKVGDIEEFEDNAFRKELKVEDIESIVDDETSEEEGGYKLSMDENDPNFREAMDYRGKSFQDTLKANLTTAKDLKATLASSGLNLDHVFKVYSDKRKSGHRVKVMLAVYGGAVSGKKAVDKKLAKKLGDKLRSHGAEDVKITSDEITFNVKK